MSEISSNQSLSQTESVPKETENLIQEAESTLRKHKDQNIPQKIINSICV